MAFEINKIESIRFKNLTYSHGGGVNLFNEVDFEFPTNGISLITGLNGAGRSTLLQLLANLLEPQNGQYFINGENVYDMSFEQFLPYRLGIGFSFESGGLIVNRTLEQNLLLPLMYHQLLDPKEAQDRVEFFLVSLGIYNQKDERPAHVSGGTRKACAILRALIMKPQLLLLDDPTVTMSHDTTQLLVAFLEQMIDEGALNHVFMTSHNDRFMDCFEYNVIQIRNRQLSLLESGRDNKVVNL